jgi:hypothetical protein
MTVAVVAGEVAVAVLAGSSGADSIATYNKRNTTSLRLYYLAI